MDKDEPENRKRLRQAFKEYGMGDFEMIERMQFVAGWTDFYLNNGLKLDLMVKMEGLEEFTFDQCLAVATIADIDGVYVPFYTLTISSLIKKQLTDQKIS